MGQGFRIHHSAAFQGAKRTRKKALMVQDTINKPLLNSVKIFF
jgi:hypothetical protein